MDILKCPKMKNPGGFGQRFFELSLNYFENIYSKEKIDLIFYIFIELKLAT